jgi:multicomponent Na+:H+ antiporter subunit F
MTTTVYWILIISLFILSISGLVALSQLRGKMQLPDRVVTLDLIGMTLVGVMIANAVLWDQPVYLDAMLAFVMVAFLATVGIARFLEERGRQR